MAEDNTLNDRFDIRINRKVKDDFIKRCAELKQQPQSLLREIMVAFNECRLRIYITNDELKSQKKVYEELYNVD